MAVSAEFDGQALIRIERQADRGVLQGRPFDQITRQRRDDERLDRSLQWPRSITRVEPFAREVPDDFIGPANLVPSLSKRC